MVEEDGELHVVLYTPPSHFDAAIILRTLYTGLGGRGWTLNIVGMGRHLPLKLVSDSRVPVAVALERVRLEEPSYNSESCIYLVDSRGSDVDELREKPDYIVVDYTMTSFSEDKARCVKRVRSLGLPSLTYEAIGVIYAVAIRPRIIKASVREEAIYGDVRRAIYLARKLAEGLRVFDNYLVLEPNTVAYVVRRLYISEGYIVDPVAYTITINPIDGYVVQEVKMRAYDKRYRVRGEVVVRIGRDRITVSDWRGVRCSLALDRLRRMVCVTRDLCFAASKPEAGEVSIPEHF